MPWHCICVTADDRLRSNRICPFTRLPQDSIQSSTLVITPLLICYSSPPPTTHPHSDLYFLTYLHTKPGVTDLSSYMLFVLVITQWCRYDIILNNYLSIMYFVSWTILLRFVILPDIVIISPLAVRSSAIWIMQKLMTSTIPMRLC